MGHRIGTALVGPLTFFACASFPMVLGGCGDDAPALTVTLDSGHVSLRRLNRVEYNNTVRDLLGTPQTPADRFPDDEVADGFDTVGEFLAFTTERAQSAEDAAGALMDELFALPVGDDRRARVMVCELQPGAEADCARQVLSGFARRAWRRRPAPDEVDELMQVIDEAQAAGATPEEGLRNALILVLISPHFLYQVETAADPQVTDPQTISDDELATRLSYFLWSTMPDDQLFAAADAHVLSRQLTSQVRRMLDDPRASALAADFAGQWLAARSVPGFAADTSTFPTFTPALAADAARETTAFFADLVHEDLPLETLLLASFTFANGRLGDDYGIAVASDPTGDGTGAGDDLVRTDLTGTPRTGILTQASFLMTTSLPSRTSPVKRGAWVLDRLLCSPPDPPPPTLNIPPLMVPPPGATLRQILEAHRANPICGSCHNLMDPIGLGLENFDAIGQYRTMDNGAPIDASGMLPDGQTFSGAQELAPLLARDPRFAPCAMQKLLTYAVGRPFSTEDGRAYAAALSTRAIATGRGTWRGWLETVVQSQAFLTRRGATPTDGEAVSP